MKTCSNEQFFFYDDDDGGGDNGDDVDADNDDNADDASYLGVRHEGADKLSVVAANPVEVGAVHRLVLLLADECVVKDKPLDLEFFLLPCITSSWTLSKSSFGMLKFCSLSQLVTPTTRAMMQKR